MTLHQFNALTARIPDTMLRCAIVAALANGVPRTAQEFSLFHEDVIDELRFTACRPSERVA